MLKNLTLTDKLLFVSAFLSLIYAETLFFNKEFFSSSLYGSLGTFNPSFWYLFKTFTEQKKWLILYLILQRLLQSYFVLH